MKKWIQRWINTTHISFFSSGDGRVSLNGKKKNKQIHLFAWNFKWVNMTSNYVYKYSTNGNNLNLPTRIRKNARKPKHRQNFIGLKESIKWSTWYTSCTIVYNNVFRRRRKKPAWIIEFVFPNEIFDRDTHMTRRR